MATKQPKGEFPRMASEPKGRIVTLSKKGEKFMVTKDRTSFSQIFSDLKKAEKTFEFMVTDSQNLN